MDSTHYLYQTLPTLSLKLGHNMAHFYPISKSISRVMLYKIKCICFQDYNSMCFPQHFIEFDSQTTCPFSKRKNFNKTLKPKIESISIKFVGFKQPLQAPSCGPFLLYGLSTSFFRAKTSKASFPELLI